MNVGKLPAVSLAVIALSLFLGCGSSTSSFNNLADSHAAVSLSGSVSGTQHPLVAQYAVTSSGAGQVKVEFGTDTSYGRNTASQPVSAAGSQISILVAGMHPGTTYHMRARLDGADGSTVYDSDHTFSTGTLPSAVLPAVGIKTGGNSSAEPGVELISAVGPQVTAVALDTDGSVIWYYYDPSLPAFTFPVRQCSNGHFLVQYYSTVREIDLAGDTIRELTLDQLNNSLAAAGYDVQALGFHHDVLRLDNGHWIVLVNMHKDYPDLSGSPLPTIVLGDVLIDVDQNNQPVWVWRTFDHLDVQRHPYQWPDWTHSNAVVYTPDGNLLLSMRHQNWVIKINYADGAGNGDILWRLGPEGDFTLAQNDPAQWFYDQHFPVILQSQGPQMRLGLFDNGNTRPDSRGRPCEEVNDCYSRGIILDLDESARTANVSWQYSLGWYSFWGGSVSVLPDGQVELDSTAPNGGYSRIVAVDGSSSPRVNWEMDATNANFYRGYRISSLYPGVWW